MAGFEPKILAFTCKWCSYAGADLVGESKIQYPSNVRLIKVMCSGSVTPGMLLHAFASGLDGLLFIGCKIGECHYVSGNKKAEEVYETTRRLMKALGLDPKRLRQELISKDEDEKFANIATEFTDEMKNLGANPLGKAKAKAQ